MSIDHEHVSALLNIVAQCAGHSGKLGALSNAAMTELTEINSALHEEGMAKRRRAEAEAAKPAPIIEEQPVVEEGAPPFVHPGSSETATIADRRL